MAKRSKGHKNKLMGQCLAMSALDTFTLCANWLMKLNQGRLTAITAGKRSTAVAGTSVGATVFVSGAHHAWSQQEQIYLEHHSLWKEFKNHLHNKLMEKIPFWIKMGHDI